MTVSSIERLNASYAVDLGAIVAIDPKVSQFL